uniref:Uncharacterized protein n=1 Tax=Vitis vinifera TaxID=29760 RepID=A5BW29_VITVI|nr:hypothetical protein VITISV_009041 [Vitis vinifera]
MKELQPLEANHSKRKEDFLQNSCEISLLLREFRSHFAQCTGAECEISGEGGMSAGQNSSLGGMSYVARHKGDRLRVQGVETPPPDDTERASLSGATPSGFPKRTRCAFSYPDSLREKHMALANITPRTITYPIRICCPDH